MTEPLLKALALSPDCLLLDAGGGTGRVAAALRDLVRNVFVMDVSKRMLRYASGKGLTAVLAPAEFIPLPSESIDRIIMMDALHHVKNQRQTGKEIWRVLAPGGRILIIEPDIRRLLVKLIAISEKILLMRSHFFNAEEISSLFTDSHCRVSMFINEYNLYFIAEKRGELNELFNLGNNYPKNAGLFPILLLIEKKNGEVLKEGLILPVCGRIVIFEQFPRFTDIFLGNKDLDPAQSVHHHRKGRMTDRFLDKFHIHSICLQVTFDQFSLQATLNFGQVFPISLYP